jgi:hypothetical protein
MGALAPEITTVSKPNKNPARATVSDQFQVLFMSVVLTLCNVTKFEGELRA